MPSALRAPILRTQDWIYFLGSSCGISQANPAGLRCSKVWRRFFLGNSGAAAGRRELAGTMVLDRSFMVMSSRCSCSNEKNRGDYAAAPQRLKTAKTDVPAFSGRAGSAPTSGRFVVFFQCIPHPSAGAQSLRGSAKWQKKPPLQAASE